MEVRAYVYVEDGEGNDYCFKCAVEAAIQETADDLDLVLEAGSTGDGNDMRSAPKCRICGSRFSDHCIA